ncbi:MAG: hypothetical protein ACOCP8_04795 [archaeon]
MEITIVGYIVFLLVTPLVLFDIKYLFIAVIFLAPFQSTAIINISELVGVMPSYYAGMLFILRYGIEKLYQRDFLFTKTNLFLITFLCYAFIISVFNFFGTFTISIFTQLIYFIFCFLFYFFALDYLVKKGRKNLNLFIKSLILTFVIIIFLGYYMALFPNNLVTQILENRVDVGIHTSGGFWIFPRLKSVALEPSMYALYLLPTMGLIINMKYPFIAKLFIIFIGVVTGVLTNSSSFMVGVIFFVIFYFFFEGLIIPKEIRITSMKKIFLFLLLIVIVLILYIIFTQPLKILFLSFVDKIFDTDFSYATKHLVKHSSSQRYDALKESVQYLQDSFFLGKGFGYFRSKDLLGTLLANTGLIGFFLFLSFFAYNFIKIRFYLKNKNERTLIKGFTYYHLLFIFIALIAVPEIYYLFFWINIAIYESLLK